MSSVVSFTQTATAWVNFFKNEDFIQNRLPGFKEKQILDNWTIIIGANDRSNLMGPNLSMNIGANYSTSYDLFGFMVNSYLKAGTYAKAAGKLVFGSGDIKLAFGPSTSLLYGGPGGSSKRGPYWDRIAGTWWDPRAKGAKYSAEGSFSPKAVGKGAGDGLQFFERDQIFGEENQDGYKLAIMVKSGKRYKYTPTVTEVAGNGNENIRQINIGREALKLDNLKKEKYESDLEKCYTKTEMKILEGGDKAAQVGMLFLAVLDLAVNLFAVLNAKLNTQAGIFTSTDNMAKATDQRDLEHARRTMIVRLAYKTAKILALQLMELFENTERLARNAIESRDKMEDVEPNDYVTNEFLKAEKRLAVGANLIWDAYQKIGEDKESRLKLSAKLIAETAQTMINEGKTVSRVNV